MSKYEEALSRLGERVLARLEGPGGLLAVTEGHLVFVGEGGVRQVELARIRRIARAEGQALKVEGEGVGLEIPLRAFPLEELKAFLEGLKPHVARARKGTAARPEAPPPPPPPSPPPSPWEEEARPQRDSVELAPEPRAVPEPPRESPSEGATRRRNPLALPLKVLALLTLGYTVAFAALNPGADPWALAGVVLGGLGLALTEWSLATSSR